ncbi:outer membrane lipoprotein-sorting protein [Oleiphilus messinensis]|uniref:Outer membrane lipoprotein-sorting protein n=1 Tax=Oleiphilus messinensis TaxID=141451 RepID=A0A1Y0IAX5_9GAMM|nr:outer membrane lipoprotein-sorting protein [Oleiphilus messinensis]ARU57682.1 outer membrane lipoprotein-sorting protein [Oleiphilus messinensis]
MKRTRMITGIFFSSLLMCLSNVVWAQSAAEKGLEIAREADRRDQGWVDSTADMKMILRNKRGDESVRLLRSKGLEVIEDGDQSIIVFDQPADVRGTALLTYSHKTGPDDQWLYLPALKRVKRIASSNKSGPFMGSEFAFEDMGAQEVEQYTYKYLRDESCNELTCFVIERYPTDENSGYSKQIAWIDQQEYRIYKVEYYDRKDSLLKTLTLSKFYKYLDKFWRAHDNFMMNHQTGKSTRLLLANFKFDIGLDKADFSQNSLKRAQ